MESENILAVNIPNALTVALVAVVGVTIWAGISKYIQSRQGG